MLAIADLDCTYESNRWSFLLAPNDHRKTASQGRAPRRECQTRLQRATLRAVRRGPGTSLAPPAGVRDVSCAIRRRFAIRGVDVSGGRDREFGAAGGLCWEGGEPFYGTWQVHGGTILLPVCPELRNLPFSLLRMLIQATPNRRQKAECRMKTRLQSATARRVDTDSEAMQDINATSKPPQSVLIARR